MSRVTAVPTTRGATAEVCATGVDDVEIKYLCIGGIQDRRT
ncbi:hypothetical protein WKW79_00905 [Variovorax robiniae]|uniref:Uncharacterized protein n=1 Tax=Variovorax robiniae TaxID=1836199 RepID=A0ABU8WZY7_9BURK